MSERYSETEIAGNYSLLAARYGDVQTGIDCIVAEWPKARKMSAQTMCDHAAYIVSLGLWTEGEARHALIAAGIDLA